MEKITYTNKVALNDVPSIADINKCKASDLNEIKNVVNTNADDAGNIIIVGDETEATEDTKLIIEEDDMNLDLQGSDFLNEYSESTEKGYSCDYVNKALVETYSTDEVKTNKVWIDGKPIYRKVFVVNSPTTAGAYTTIANIGSNVVDTLIKATSMILVKYTTNNQVFYNLNIDEGDVNHYCLIAYNKNSGNIQVKVGTEFRNQQITIVLEYTKTTD